MSIGIFFEETDKINGPNKVAINLMLGLNKLGILYVKNIIGEKNGCLQSWVSKIMELPLDTLFGPNIEAAPNIPAIWNKYNRFIANCQWTFDGYGRWAETKGKMVGIWPVGIDTDRFNDSGRHPTKDCLVYFKDPLKRLPVNELKGVLEQLENKKLSFSVLKYGSYKEDDLIRATKEHRFCLLETDTESQGIAYMEILSSGLPCYVLNMSTVSEKLSSSYGLKPIKATSVPYFTSDCGIKDESRSMSYLDEFLDRINEFFPRNYILKKHTLEIAAKRYVDLLYGKDTGYAYDKNEEE